MIDKGRAIQLGQPSALTTLQVNEIRSLGPSFTLAELAEKYGISRTVVSNVLKFKHAYGVEGSDVPIEIKPRKASHKILKLSTEQISYIKATDMPNTFLAYLFDVNKVTISKIRTGRARRVG